MDTHLEQHVCYVCDNKRLAEFEVVHIRPIYFGSVYTLNCRNGHLLIEWRRQ